MDEEGSRNQAFLSEGSHFSRPLEGASLLGTVEDMLRKALDMGISLLRGPSTSEGNLESGGGVGAHIPRTLNDEWRALGMGHLSMRGTWREGSITGDPKRYVK
jgi:hypothetical protein